VRVCGHEQLRLLATPCHPALGAARGVVGQCRTRQASALSGRLDSQRWHPWFGGAGRDDYDAQGRQVESHFGALNAVALESRLRPLRATR
jgi:hypothetical protein